MKKFEVPTMNVMKLTSEDIFTNSQCTVAALGCTSCYCVAVDCDEHNPQCTTDCYGDWDSM